MKTINLAQGSPEWHAHRATARNASDAPAVLGCSPYKTRAQLLHERHTGVTPEVDAATQRRFADGHAIEAAQRAGAEQIIGDDLAPVVGVDIVDGLELSASFDGLPMLDPIPYECKSLNDDLRACMDAVGGIEANDGANLPKHYRVQLEQQLMVCGGTRALFVAATRDGQDVRRCWYHTDAALRAEIIAGWRQFDADLADYVPPGPVERIVAEPVESLPAPVVKVSGQLTLQDNFKVFEQRVRDFLEHRLIREPKTDQDFANLDAQIKEIKQGRDALKAAKAQGFAQIEPIDRMAKTADMLDKLLQQHQAMAEKVLASEKERRRGEIVSAGVTALREHIAALNARLGKPYMPAIPADFGAAIKGRSSLAKMEEAVAQVLTNAKIAANETADRIDANIKHLDAVADEFGGLFHDAETIVLKARDDFQALVKTRITDEQRRREMERERIRREEAERLQREQQERAAEEARQSAPAATPAPTQPPATTSPSVVPMPARAPAAEAATMKLGEINAMLAPLSIDAAGLAKLGFSPVSTEKSAKLYAQASFPAMVDTLVAHLRMAAEKYREAA